MEGFWDEFGFPLLAGLLYLVVVIGASVACYNLYG